jgi:hypothetical protein
MPFLIWILHNDADPTGTVFVLGSTTLVFYLATFSASTPLQIFDKQILGLLPDPVWALI